MPKLSNSLPKYRCHKASGQAIVTLAGKHHYLGPHGTKASRLEYGRMISEWVASGRPAIGERTKSDLTINEMFYLPGRAAMFDTDFDAGGRRGSGGLGLVVAVASFEPPLTEVSEAAEAW